MKNNKLIATIGILLIASQVYASDLKVNQHDLEIIIDQSISELTHDFNFSQEEAFIIQDQLRESIINKLNKREDFYIEESGKGNECRDCIIKKNGK